MQASDYQQQELHFAYCYHAYLHWRTHRRRPYPDLATLDQGALHALVEPLGLHVFECDSRPTECRALVSLRPDEPLSAAASKVKGRVSKWLRQRLELQEPKKLLARGYFACTSGGTTQDRVDAYLDAQGAHHGYSERVRSPTFVATYQPETEPQPWWHADHACTHLQFHIVLATASRRGVFGSEEGAAVAGRWAEIQRERRFALRKVSFVPDHVHVALWLHPALAPAELVVSLMNEGQQLLAERFAGNSRGPAWGGCGKRALTSAATAIWRRRRCRSTYGAGRRWSSNQPNDPRPKAGGFSWRRRWQVANNRTIPAQGRGLYGAFLLSSWPRGR